MINPTSVVQVSPEKKELQLSSRLTILIPPFPEQEKQISNQTDDKGMNDPYQWVPAVSDVSEHLSEFAFPSLPSNPRPFPPDLPRLAT